LKRGGRRGKRIFVEDNHYFNGDKKGRRGPRRNAKVRGRETNW